MRTLKVHPKSNITIWGMWPKDIESILRQWNKDKLLTFVYITVWREKEKTIFQCDVCNEWHFPTSTVAVYKEKAMCDNCLILAARLEKE